MKIVMFTNTFVPHVGGVTRSVLTLKGVLETRGHEVLVVAPSYEGHRRDEPGVLRVPAFEDIAGSGYAVPIPMSRHIRDDIDAFGPELVHSHHPFLLGNTALRTAAARDLPTVYTWHTRYDLYAREIRPENGAVSRLFSGLSTGYANLADAVIAPSESIRQMILAQGVSTDVRAIPTGIDLAHFACADRMEIRRRFGLSADDFVVGHLGRLSREKNLDYLAEAVVVLLRSSPEARFLLSGKGPELAALEQRFVDAGVSDRVHILEWLKGSEIASFYACLDVFAFSSLSETQGLVVSEALASGCPVVALDSPGVREAVRDCEGSFLLEAEASPRDFAATVAAFASLSGAEKERRRVTARRSSEAFSIERMGASVERLYLDLVSRERSSLHNQIDYWESKLHELTKEAELVENLFHALGMAIRPASMGTSP